VNEFAKDVVRALGRSPSDDITRLHRRIAELGEQLDDAITARDHHHGMYDQAQQLAVRMERERDEARADAVTNGQAAERLSGELAEARHALEYAQIQNADHEALGRRLIDERNAAVDEVRQWQAAYGTSRSAPKEKRDERAGPRSS
jgi:chromosome segregation ATPase